MKEVERDWGRGTGAAIKPSTARNYAQFIDRFMSWVDKPQFEALTDDKDVPDIAKMIDEWLYQLEGVEGYELKASTKAIAGMAVKSYIDYIYYINFDYKNIRHCRRVLSREKFEPDLFTLSEVEEVFDNLSLAGHDDKGFPEMITIGWNCIARRSEIVQIKTEDVDLDRPSLTIRGVKGSADHTFDTDDPVSDDLWASLESRYDPEEAYLFPSGKGHVAPVTLTVWFGRDLCKRHLFGRHRSIHVLCRHTRITSMIDGGMDAIRVQKLARHKFLHTTQRYDKEAMWKRLKD